MRILLFLGTNIAVMALLGLTFSLIGIQGLLAENGVDLNLNALLVYAAVIGFSGAFISLFLSKFLAKRSMKVHVIVDAENQTERWLVDTVQNMAKKAGIGMPEVGIFSHSSPNAFATGWNKNNALVAVSTGLLEAMPKNEIDAVFSTIKSKFKLTDNEASYFVFQDHITNNAYNPKMDKINILLKNGKMLDIKEAADTFNISALSTPVKKWFLCFPKH